MLTLCCIFSGLIPTLHHSTDKFSRLFSADEWLFKFCQSMGYGFIPNFNDFWNTPGLYRDLLHPNKAGLTVLAKNISNHLINSNYSGRNWPLATSVNHYIPDQFHTRTASHSSTIPIVIRPRPITHRHRQQDDNRAGQYINIYFVMRLAIDWAFDIL